MSIRIPFARELGLALVTFLLLSVLSAASASAETVQAKLRVLTPDRVLDPGTTYVVGKEEVTTDPAADCTFGGAGGSGATYEFPEPVALGLLQAASRATASLRPVSVTDEFGFGLAICAIGGVDDHEGAFWYLKKNHRELTVGADQEPIANGDELLIYLAPDNFPAPNPAELELVSPPRVEQGSQFSVSVLEHACVTDPNPPYETSCEMRPASGVTVTGAGQSVTTGPDGTATLVATEAKRIALSATRGSDIPSGTLRTCVAEQLEDCPAVRGERIVGTGKGDRIRSTRGADSIRARGGDDRIDIRRGAKDKVDCGGGEDEVLVRHRDRDDRIAKDCERIR